MSRKKRYIKPLTASEKVKVEAEFKHGKSHAYRQRCHAILLSNSGHSVPQITSILSVTQQAVYSWFDRWESGGISELKTRQGQGRKPLLKMDNKDHVKGVEKAVSRVNKKGGNLLAEVEAELDLEPGLTKRILRSFLKKTGIRGNEVVESSKKELNKPKLMKP